MLRKTKVRARMRARRFFAAASWRLARAYAWLMWFYVRYLEGVRWGEFCTGVGAAFAAGTGMAITLQVPLAHAPYVGYLLAFFTGMSYLRIPKKPKSEEDTTSGTDAPSAAVTPTVPSSESEASDGNESQSSAPSGS